MENFCLNVKLHNINNNAPLFGWHQLVTASLASTISQLYTQSQLQMRGMLLPSETHKIHKMLAQYSFCCFFLCWLMFSLHKHNITSQAESFNSSSLSLYTQRRKPIGGVQSICLTYKFAAVLLIILTAKLCFFFV